MQEVISRSVGRCACVPVKPKPSSPSSVTILVPTTPQCVIVCVESEIESALTGICRMKGSTDRIFNRRASHPAPELSPRTAFCARVAVRRVKVQWSNQLTSYGSACDHVKRDRDRGSVAAMAPAHSEADEQALEARPDQLYGPAGSAFRKSSRCGFTGRLPR